MAPTYKLTYFDVMALGEPIRYMLAYGNINFEDKRIPRESWPKLKPKTPYGKMPVLEIGEKKAHQSISICRYLSKKVGLGGIDDWQNLKIDSTVDTVVDIRIAIFNLVFAPESEKEKMRETFDKETLPFYLNRLDEQVKENGGFFVDKKLTWADLHFAATIDSAKEFLKTNPVEDYPHLKALVDKVWNLPRIKSWRANRPVSSI
ncbi:Glutathione S-transferase [Gryllus bimaculatus]|nr:Glutathione S-transferase [Gryllus bimaculatus]